MRNGFSSWKGNSTLRNAVGELMGDESDLSQQSDRNSKCRLFSSVRRHYVLINQPWWFMVMFSSWYLCLATRYPNSRPVQGTSHITKPPIPGSFKPLIIVATRGKWRNQDTHRLVQDLGTNRGKIHTAQAPTGTRMFQRILPGKWVCASCLLLWPFSHWVMMEELTYCPFENFISLNN